MSRPGNILETLRMVSGLRNGWFGTALSIGETFRRIDNTQKVSNLTIPSGFSQNLFDILNPSRSEPNNRFATCCRSIG